MPCVTHVVQIFLLNIRFSPQASCSKLAPASFTMFPKHCSLCCQCIVWPSSSYQRRWKQLSWCEYRFPAVTCRKPTNAAFVMHHVLTATLRGLLIHFVHNASAHTLLTVVRAGAFALDVPPGMLSFDRFSRRSPAPNSIHAQTLTLPSQFARGSPLLYSRGCWHRH